jgi:hypothetical protein
MLFVACFVRSVDKLQKGRRNQLFVEDGRVPFFSYSTVSYVVGTYSILPSDSTVSFIPRYGSGTVGFVWYSTLQYLREQRETTLPFRAGHRNSDVAVLSRQTDSRICDIKRD